MPKSKKILKQIYNLIFKIKEIHSSRLDLLRAKRLSRIQDLNYDKSKAEEENILNKIKNI